MNEYRMTRNGPYSDHTCAGHDDLTARRVHYVVASTEDGAQEIMLKEFPRETFTCQFLREMCKCVKVAGMRKY